MGRTGDKARSFLGDMHDGFNVLKVSDEDH